MLAFSFLLPFLRKYGAVLAIVLAILGSYWYVSHRAVSNDRAKRDRDNYREVLKRTDEEKKVIERVNRVRREVENSRRSTPNDDNRDSCLLSHDPTKTDCAGRSGSTPD